MNDIALKISVEETNLVLEGLGNLPFVKVHELIRKIHQQASSQLQPPDTTAPAAGKASVANIGGFDSERQTAVSAGADVK